MSYSSVFSATPAVTSQL